MKIAVNTRLLLKDRLEGIGWFSKETLSRICKDHPEHEFYFIFDRAFDPSYIFSDNVKGFVLNPQARHPILFKLFFNWSIPKFLKKHEIDVFLSPDGFLSLRTEVAQIAVIHDLNFEHFPEALPRHITKYYKHYFPRFAKKAARIATVSKYSKLDISSIYGIDPSKIDVVYNGANKDYKVLDEKSKTLVRDKVSNGKAYFLYVGSLHKRKNVLNLIKAYDQFRRKNENEHSLVIVGTAMWSNKDIDQELERTAYSDDILFLGRKQLKELTEIMGAASALCFIPFFEGFGIPALEAMQSGVPVIASNTSSIPEVVGEAALISDPNDIDEISENMSKVCNDEELRNEMIRKGLEQSKKFSWNKSAEALWNTINTVINA